MAEQQAQVPPPTKTEGDQKRGFGKPGDKGKPRQPRDRKKE
jgi:hypothetical protein